MDDVAARGVARARERFLAGGEVDGAVRADILTSWQRSVIHGLTPSTAVPRPSTQQQTGSADRLLRAAEPLLAHQRDTLAGLNAGFSLTDRNGRLLGRWVESSDFARRLDARLVLPGMCVAEHMIGTSSGGTSLVTGSAVVVVGHEHFSEGAVTMASAGVPVRHPVTRRIVGSLNLSCPAGEASPLILPWITELVVQIESQLLDQSTRDQRVLFDAFLTSVQDARHPVVCLDEHTVITNVAAARLLDASDHAMLWEIAARRLKGGHTDAQSISLSTGHHVRVVCTPVVDGGHGVGALMRLTAVRPAPGRAATPPHAGHPVLPSLDAVPGRSATWQRFTAQVRRARGESRLVRIAGEAGTSKTRVARAVAVDAGEPCVLSADVSTGGTWVDDLTLRLVAETSVVLLRRLDLLDPDTYDATMRLLRTHLRPGTEIIATEVLRGDGDPHGSMEWPGVTVVAPPLRERVDDLPQIVEAMMVELTGKHGDRCSVRWSAEAIQVLSRLVWPNNLHTLRALVESVCAQVADPIVLPRHIPAHLVARGSQRQLSSLEHVEAHAVVQALQTARGNKRQAADALGIARSTLYRKVKALGLDLSTSAY